MDRAEAIAALVTDKFSGFKEGDESILEAASDARLEEFRNSSDSRRLTAAAATKLETEHRNTSARLKIAEDRLKTAEQPLTEEQFMERAPEQFKAVLEEHRAAEAAFRASLISQLKDLGANTEEELKKKSTDDLKTLAAYARVDVIDFSARGMPKERNAESFGSNANYAPPDPYKAGLDKLRAQGK